MFLASCKILLQDLGHVEGTVQLSGAAKLIFQLRLEDFEDSSLYLVFVILGQMVDQGIGFGGFTLPDLK